MSRSKDEELERRSYKVGDVVLHCPSHRAYQVSPLPGTVWIGRGGEDCELVVNDPKLYARFIVGGLPGQTRRP
ncbi:MAG: hypothetical protein ACYDEA_01290 [Candidatus Dormibacteria bacterium]